MILLIFYINKSMEVIRMEGLCIAIEGIDGSGKNTLARNLQAKLQELGNEVEIVSFPRHKEEFSSELVDKFLYEGLKFDDDEYRAFREGMLYAVDRMVALSRIQESGKSRYMEWKEGKTFIFDRYITSNFIHRCNKMSREELKVYMMKMEYLEFDLMGIPRPDITFVLSVKPEVSYQNIINRGRETDENESLENLTKSYENLEYLCKTRGYVLVDCCKLNDKGEYEMLTREEILDKVWNIMLTYK